MSDTMPALLTAATTFLKQVCPNLGLALSEALNLDVGLEVDRVEAVPIQDILSRTEESLWTTFSLSAPHPSESVLLISDKTAIAIAETLAGRTIGAEGEKLSEQDVELLTAASAGLVRGLATALANTTGDSVDIESCVTNQGAFTLPPVFAMEQSGIEAHLTLILPEMPEHSIHMLFTPEFVDALANLNDSSGAEEPDSNLLDDSDLAAMLSELEGIGSDFGGEKPGAAASAAPAPPFSNFPTGPPESNNSRGMERIMDIPLDVTVELGRVRMLIRDVLDLASGSIIELDRLAGEPVDLLVNGRLVAKGEVVVIEDNFGIRLTEIVSPADRVVGLGKGR